MTGTSDARAAAPVIAGRYEVAELLGRGGASRVHAARDLVTGARVAVKLLDSGVKDTSPRVRREISALRLLRLPGVVSLLDEGVHEGAPFLVMGVAAGEPFPGRAGVLPWDTIAAPTLALLEVLARVHAAGVVHRDLKPSNVLVDADGRVTIVDFGISWGPALGDHVTSAGVIVGTPEYLAPEQLVGGGADARTDLYAVGEMLYEALTGAPPHVAEDFNELLARKRARVPTPVRRRAPDVPREVAQVVEQLLAIEPSDRPQSAGEVLASLFGVHRSPGGAVAMPRLGGTAALDRLVAAASEGCSLDVSGPRGSGRSRLLADAAERLAASGRRVLWALPGSAPYSSLAAALGGFDDLRTAGRAEAEAAIDERLRRELRAGAVVCADDAERLDRWSAAALERGRGAGTVVRVTNTPAPDGIVLSELSESDLRELFAGPDRIFHLREDGARELAMRTGGLPARIVVEIAAWARAGFAHWSDGRVVVRRQSLDRLRGGLTLGDELLLSPGTASASTARLDELLSWIALAWPHSTQEVLAGATKQPLWTLEPEIDALLEDSLVRRLPDGRFLPLVVPRLLQSWDAERRRAAHRALAYVLAPGTPYRLRHLAAAGEPTEVADEALLVAPELSRRGRVADSLVVLDEGLAAAREAGDRVREQRVLVEMAKACLAGGIVGAVDRAIYEVGRSTGDDAPPGPIENLLRCAREAMAGDPERALARLAALPASDDLDLELWRHGMRVRAAQQLPLARRVQVLEEVERWARGTGHPRAVASAGAWRGLYLMETGRCAEAARLHLDAVSTSQRVPAQIAARLNAASAFLDAGLLDDARRAAEAARDAAAACRAPASEAHAEFLVRQIQYRSGDAGEPDPEFAEAAGSADPPSEGPAFFNEAAVAWRLGRTQQARALASRSVRAFARIGRDSWGLAARSLEIACGAPPEPGEIELLARRAEECAEPESAVQALGLLALAAPSNGDEFRALALRRSAEPGGAVGGARGVILSLDEIVTGRIETGPPR
jgi:eukaryotic-like serine/threonine-protein kinase